MLALTRRRYHNTRRALDLAVGVVGSVVAALAFCWPLPKHLGTQLPRTNNDPLFATWALAAYHRRWDGGELFPLFAGNNFFPHADALAFSDTFLGQAVLSYPFHVLGAGPVATHNLCLLLVYALVGAAAYAAGRALSGSVLGGAASLLVMGYAQPRFVFLDHFNIQSGWLLPLALAAAVRLLRGPSWRAALLLGVSLGLQWWFTGQAVVFWTVAAVVPLGVALLVSVVRSPRRRAVLVQVSAAVALALVIAAPVLAAHLRVTDAFSVQRSVSDNVSYSVPPREWLNSTQSSWLMKRLGRADGFPMYVGWVGVGLAAAGTLLACRPKRRRRVRARALDAALPALAVAGMAGVAWVLSLGPLLRPEAKERLPYAWLLEVVPGLGSIRAPARFYVPLEVCLALLAALPVGLLARWLWKRHPALTPVAAVLPFLAGWDLWPPPFPLGGVPARSPALEQLGQEHPGASVNEIPDGRPENHTATFRSAFHALRTTAGTSGTTPPLTGALYCRANRFPEPETVDLLRALGVEYVAIHDDQRPYTRDLPVDALPAGVTPWRAVGPTRIFSLGPPLPALYSAVDLHGRTFPLRVSSAVAAGKRVNAALDLAGWQEQVRASVHPAAGVEVRLTDASGRTTVQSTRLRLPAILDRRTTEATFTFMAPQPEGPLHVAVHHEGVLLGEGRTQVGRTPLGAEASTLTGLQLTLDASESTWLTGRCAPLRVHVKNGSGAILQAYPDPLGMPLDAGRTVLDVEFAGGPGGRSGRAHQWNITPSLLWHDVGPGDEATVVAEIEAPGTPGSFTLRARLGVVTRGHAAQAEVPLEVRRRP